MRLDVFLSRRIQKLTRSRVQKIIEQNQVKVGGVPRKPSYRLSEADWVECDFELPEKKAILPEDIPFKIWFEDDHVIVLEKSSGMVVHPAYGNYSGTLVNAVLFHLQKQQKNIDPNMGPLLVHRIDKDTSGLMIIAKNEESQLKLSKQFFDHSISRKYLALVWGDVKDDSGTITGHIARSPKNRKVFIVTNC